MSPRFQFDDTFLFEAQPLRKAYRNQTQNSTLWNSIKTILALLLIGFATFFLFFQNTKPLTATSYSFGKAIQQNQWQQAYQHLSPSLQSQYSLETFTQTFSTSLLNDSKSSLYFNTIKPSGKISTLQGIIRKDNLQLPILLELTKEKSTWNITNILIGTDPFAQIQTPILTFGK